MRAIVMVSVILFLSLIGCKEKQTAQLPAESVEGKYVKEINHYTINFEDGTSYDMNEKLVNKIYYMTRHAEKDTTVKGDPPLSPKGLERATRLADIFRNTQIDALYSTMTTRTLFTVDSLADLKGLVTLPYEAKGFRDLAGELDKSLDIHKTLIVGHSNTTPVLANHLYGETAIKKAIDESDYENLLIVIENIDGTMKLLRLKFK